MICTLPESFFAWFVFSLRYLSYWKSWVMILHIMKFVDAFYETDNNWTKKLRKFYKRGSKYCCKTNESTDDLYSIVNHFVSTYVVFRCKSWMIFYFKTYGYPKMHFELCLWSFVPCIVCSRPIFVALSQLAQVEYLEKCTLVVGLQLESASPSPFVYIFLFQ